MHEKCFDSYSDFVESECNTSSGSDIVARFNDEYGVCSNCSHSKKYHIGSSCYKVLDKGDKKRLCVCDDFTIMGDKDTDMLGTIFELQLDLQDRVKSRDFFWKPKEEQVEKLCVAAIHELVELRDIMNWKWWKSHRDLGTKEWSDAKEELIDVWHFLVQLSIVMGMKPQDILEEYKKKHDVNVKRQESGY